MANLTRIFSNLASAFFLASGVWGDLLLIRVFLVCAYAFILAFQIALDTKDYENYAWGIVCLYLHGSSAVRLFLDEGRVKLDEKQEQESLWRYFYRRSGISRLLFKSYVAPCFELIDAKAGTKLDTDSYFYIILDGVVDIESTVAGSTQEVTLVSGESFDIKHLRPLFRGRSVYKKGVESISPFVNQDISATVTVDARIYRCPAESIGALCSRPESKEAAQGLLIATLSDIAERQYMKNDEDNRSLESGRSSISSSRSAIFFALEQFEEPAPYLAGSGSLRGIHRHILHTLKVAFLLPWPLMSWLPGLRQVNSLPVPKTAPDTDTETQSTMQHTEASIESPLLEDAR